MKDLQKGLPKQLNPYAEPTIELVLSLLADAYDEQTKLDQFLEELSEEVLADLMDVLESMVKDGKFDWNKKIDLYNHPALYQALKDVEREQLHRFTEYTWMGDQVIAESMKHSYQKTLLQTYTIYNKPVPSLTANVQIRDTYFKQNVLPVPWCQDGKVYSERLYGHVANFQSKLSYVLEEGISKGKGMEWMTKAWRKLTGSAAYDTARLLKTETMAMWSLATKSSLLEMGVEYVEILGDAACGGICMDFVGDAVPLSEAVIGDLLPPYHPNCACSFIEYTEMVSADEALEEDEIY